MPLQPLDDGIDRKFAHSDRFCLADDQGARSTQLLDDECVRRSAAGERPGPSRRRHPRRVDVVLDDDRDAQQRAVVALPTSLVSRPRIGERRGADGDDRVQLRVQLLDPVQVELGQLDRRESVTVHERLELRDGRRVDVDSATVVDVACRARPIGAAMADTTSSSVSRMTRPIDRRAKLRIARDLRGVGGAVRGRRTETRVH